MDLGTVFGWRVRTLTCQSRLRGELSRKEGFPQEPQVLRAGTRPPKILPLVRDRTKSSSEWEVLIDRRGN